jgi:hypothetical protein
MALGIGLRLGIKPSKSSGPTYTQVVSDDFNRVDATGLGTATTGQVWTDALNGWNIASNKATNRSTSNSISVLDAGVTNMRVEAALSNLATNPSILARYVDTTHFLRLQDNGTTLSLLETNGGAPVTIGSAGSSFSAGEVLRVDVNGTTASVYRNGVLLFTATTALVAGTKVGFIASGAFNNNFDDLKVYSIT